MKKRKKPYLLVTMLAILLLGAGIVSGTFSIPKGDGHGHEQEVAQQEPPSVVGEKRGSESAAAIAKSVGTAMKGQPVSARPDAKPGPDTIPMPERSSILRSKPPSYVPKPSEGSTSTQWYREEAHGSEGAKKGGK